MQKDVGCSLVIPMLLCCLANQASYAQAEDAPQPAPPAARPPVRQSGVLTRGQWELEQRMEMTGPRPEGTRWFRGQLALAYLAPLAAFGLIGLTADKDNLVVPTLVGLVGMSAPPLVHSVNEDNAGALRSLAGMVGGGGVGVLSGLAIGHIGPGDTTRARAERRDAAVFGVCGYAIWALLDISFFAFSHPNRFVWAASLGPSTSPDERGRVRPHGVELRVRATL